VNAHAAFRNLGESLIRSWVTPLMFSDCEDWETEAKRRVCRLLSGLRATVTAVSILLLKDTPRGLFRQRLLLQTWCAVELAEGPTGGRTSSGDEFRSVELANGVGTQGSPAGSTKANLNSLRAFSAEVRLASQSSRMLAASAIWGLKS